MEVDGHSGGDRSASPKLTDKAGVLPVRHRLPEFPNFRHALVPGVLAFPFTEC